MFDRTTDQARSVLDLANAEAHRWHHEYMGTEHLLLGLIAEVDGVGANVLRAAGADVSKVRPEIDKLLRKGPDMVSWGKLPMTPRAKRAMAFAIEEAREHGDGGVRPEHVALGLMREERGVAATVLRTLGVTIDGLRDAVVRLRRGD